MLVVGVKRQRLNGFSWCILYNHRVLTMLTVVIFHVKKDSSVTLGPELLDHQPNEMLPSIKPNTFLEST